ncbi:MAG: tRNA (adenosine(37)-N6)-threonylcarbamoyltransferase complex ATPase subunit type 1 TsaE [Candidatus Dadabacteria bacterium]|nr:MAG: tRNA (adenosine(37)-N6)-threonylcarbamoyltransferase complex ATPase subunit type 1 TsaE [Candidatus Dadabacteria bacterium]
MLAFIQTWRELKINKKSIKGTIEETQNLAYEISNNISGGHLILLNGEMGSGKTQFVKFLCENLDVMNIVSSPSFLILNKYQTRKKFDIFHFDFYRLQDTRDLVEIGFFEILESNDALVIIEWADMFRELFLNKKNIIDIYFNFIKDNINLREITVTR